LIDTLINVARRIRRGDGGVRQPGSRQAKVPLVAALTMVYRSPLLLQKWVDHYGSALGRENLFIISHGPCPEHEGIVAGCNYVVVPRAFSDEIDATKAALLSGFAKSLLCVYAAVVCGDTDELIVVDPVKGVGLRDYVLGLPPDSVVAPIGFNIIPSDAYYADNAARADLNAPLLRQVNRAMFAPLFCKPSVMKRPVTLSTGQHGVIGDRFTMDAGLVLFHLKYLALNPVGYYDDLADEVGAQAQGRTRQALWSSGFEGLRGRAASFEGAVEDLPVREPREAAEGCFSMDQTKDAGKARGGPFRVMQGKSPAMFALPERWLNLV
jgi:hypothetical protein